MQKFDKYAIFKTGGKQYQALPGKTISVEKIEGEAGDKIEFNEVLLVKNSETDIQVGQPFVATTIVASIVKQMRDPKVIIFKFRRRKKSRVKRGHRQPKTIIRIESF